MAELSDFPMHSEPGPDLSGGRPDRSNRPLLWVLAAIAALALGAAIYVTLRRATPAAPTPVPQAVRETAQDVKGPSPASGVLPSLDGSDAIVRGVVTALSSRPELATWLATGELARTFVAVVDEIARGNSPRSLLGEFTPREAFRAAGGGTRLRIDPRSFARYDRLASAFASLDSPGVARAYQQLAPLCESAYRELGVEGTFRGALERAMGRLLATPDVAADARLVSDSVAYRYDDDRLESLSAAQKQLLRMGPRNVRLVKDKLRELASAMGLTPRMPSP
jgi:hypothetical protein